MLKSSRKARHAAPSNTISSLKKVTAVVVTGLAVTISALSAASDGRTAYINDMGSTYTVAADSTDIESVLAEAGITLNEGDITTVTEESGDSISIDIKRAFEVNISADGSVDHVNVTGGTVAEIVKEAGIKVSPNDFVEPAPQTVLTEDSDIKITRAVKIYLEKSGETKHAYVPEGTVGDALKTIGCELCSEGNGDIKESTPVKSGMKVCVDEVLYRITTKNDKIEPSVIEEKCADLPVGEKSVKQEGKEGKIETTFNEKYINGELVEKKEGKKTVIVKPENRIILVGTKETTEPQSDVDDKTEKTVSKASDDTDSESASEEKRTAVSEEPSGTSSSVEEESKETDNISYGTLITGSCTAYYEVNGITATGTVPHVGTVAVNPNVIPYGSRLYICSSDGSYVYGYAIAEDTGSACMAGEIVVDLYMNSEEDCNAFGRRDLNIYILD